jgi:hypothetical protein
MQATTAHAAAAGGAAVHALLPLFVPRESAADGAAAALLGRIFRAPTWRDVALGDLQALLALYRSDAPPRTALLRHVLARPSGLSSTARHSMLQAVQFRTLSLRRLCTGAACHVSAVARRAVESCGLAAHVTIAANDLGMRTYAAL